MTGRDDTGVRRSVKSIPDGSGRGVVFRRGCDRRARAGRKVLAPPEPFPGARKSPGFPVGRPAAGLWLHRGVGLFRPAPRPGTDITRSAMPPPMTRTEFV